MRRSFRQRALVVFAGAEHALFTEIGRDEAARVRAWVVDPSERERATRSRERDAERFGVGDSPLEGRARGRSVAASLEEGEEIRRVRGARDRPWLVERDVLPRIARRRPALQRLERASRPRRIVALVRHELVEERIATARSHRSSLRGPDSFAFERSQREGIRLASRTPNSVLPRRRQRATQPHRRAPAARARAEPEDRLRRSVVEDHLDWAEELFSIDIFEHVSRLERALGAELDDDTLVDALALVALSSHSDHDTARIGVEAQSLARRRIYEHEITPREPRSLRRKPRFVEKRPHTERRRLAKDRCRHLLFCGQRPVITRRRTSSRLHRVPSAMQAQRIGSGAVHLHAARRIPRANAHRHDQERRPFDEVRRRDSWRLRRCWPFVARRARNVRELC